MRWFYTFIVRCYTLSIRVAAAFNPKAKQWIEGRRNSHLFDAADENKRHSWIWIHSASLGEFEQGRPVIEAIKKRFPEKKVLLTFFSPSGYEIRKSYPLADKVAYLPADTPQNARQLINTFAFEAVFFVKYEFWFNYLEALSEHKIPTYFLSARFREQQYFFRWFGRWPRRHLRQVTHFFVQDENSAKLLKSFDIFNVTVTGDTRFDRVYQISRTAQPIPVAEQFLQGRQAFVVGSSWPADEEKLMEAFGQLPEYMAVILAPHDISEKHLRTIEEASAYKTIRFSQFTDEMKAKILLVDNIGLLSQLYRYASFAYVGGGFGQNIHNIQEAVAYGCPVIVGPKYGNFTEAVDLVELGGVFAVRNAAELAEMIKRLNADNQFREHASAICRNYVEGSIGATEKVMKLVWGKIANKQ